MRAAQAMPDLTPRVPRGPAVLRLLMLEAAQAQRDRAMTEESREAARLLAASLRRAIAEAPSLTFADVVAKLEIARAAPADETATRADEAGMLSSAIQDLRRMPGIG